MDTTFFGFYGKLLTFMEIFNLFYGFDEPLLSDFRDLCVNVCLLLPHLWSQVGPFSQSSLFAELCLFLHSHILKPHQIQSRQLLFTFILLQLSKKITPPFFLRSQELAPTKAPLIKKKKKFFMHFFQTKKLIG